MMNASPGAIPSRNASMTAAVQAGNAPIWSGSTTCCATTSPLTFISAQDASCDSRTMVENPVRNSEFCISCTMPERLAFTTSRSTASMVIGLSVRYDQVLPFIHACDLAWADHGRAIELVEDRRSGDRQADIEPLALIDRAVELPAVEAHAPQLTPRVAERRARRLELRHLDRWEETNPAHAKGNDFDR